MHNVNIYGCSCHSPLWNLFHCPVSSALSDGSLWKRTLNFAHWIFFIHVLKNVDSPAEISGYIHTYNFLKLTTCLFVCWLVDWLVGWLVNRFQSFIMSDFLHRANYQTKLNSKVGWLMVVLTPLTLISMARLWIWDPNLLSVRIFSTISVAVLSSRLPLLCGSTLPLWTHKSVWETHI